MKDNQFKGSTVIIKLFQVDVYWLLRVTGTEPESFRMTGYFSSRLHATGFVYNIKDGENNRGDRIDSGVVEVEVLSKYQFVSTISRPVVPMK